MIGPSRTALGPLVVHVDASKCTGHGACVEIAPEGFALDRFNFAFVRPDLSEKAAADPELRAALRLAEVRCPERAIRIEQLRSRPAPPVVPVADIRVDRAGPECRLLSADGEAESLCQWLQGGGFEVSDPPRLMKAVEEAGLVGQGGAAYPVVAKWRAVRGVLPALIVANGAEREPGTEKDRYLMRYRPFAVVDGVRATAAALGATEAIIAIDVDNQGARSQMAAAVQEAAGHLGGLTIRVETVSSRYIAGEETALLESLAGAEPRPRAKPPFPTERGLLGRPTVVHNIETLVQVASVAARGADWFREAGTIEEPGTGLFSVSRFGGPVMVVEYPLGTSARRLITDAGWAGARAAVIGGLSGGLVPAALLDVPLANRELNAIGASLGTKSIQVLTDEDCPVEMTAIALRYFAGETSGQCPPCTLGLPYLADLLAAMAAGTADSAALAEGRAFADSLVGRGACRLPDGAVRLLSSLLRHFEGEVALHLNGQCSAEAGSRHHAPVDVEDGPGGE